MCVLEGHDAPTLGGEAGLVDALLYAVARLPVCGGEVAPEVVVAIASLVEVVLVIVMMVMVVVVMVMVMMMVVVVMVICGQVMKPEKMAQA